MKRNTLQGSSSIGAGCLFIIIILFIVVSFKKILWIIGGAVGLWLLYKTVSYLISERDGNDNHYIYQDNIELFNTRKEKKHLIIAVILSSVITAGLIFCFYNIKGPVSK